MTSSAIMTSTSASLGSPAGASSSQYLHPDYIQMLPSSLDAKNSPLALLAQTCSSIGKDPTPPLAPNSSSHKLSTGSGKDSSTAGAHHHHHNHHGKDDKPRPKSETPPSRAEDHRAPTSKCPGRDRLKDSARLGATVSTAGKGLSPPKSSSRPSATKDSSGAERLSPPDGISVANRSLVRDAVGGKPTAAAAVVSSSSVGGSLVSSTGSGGKGIPTSLPSSLFEMSADNMQRFAALHQQLSLAVAAAAAAGRGSLYGPAPPIFALDHHAFPGGAGPTTPGLYPASLAGAGTAFPSLLGPQVDPVQLQQLYAAAAASQSPSLYADYAARLKAATSSSTACKDPFCIRCPLGGPGCGAGSSVQSTAADKHSVAGGGSALLPSAAAAGSSMLPPPLPFLPAASLHALLLQQMSAAAAAAGTTGSSSTVDPLAGTAAANNGGGGSMSGSYTCSWVDGAADFCGMRFNSSDELLQHLRVHASAADPSSASLPPHPAALAALTASFPLGLASTVPRLSPVSLGEVQTPSSGSAFGPLTHGFSPSSSRYHPYKSPSAPAASAAAFSSPGGVASLATGLPGSAVGPPGAPPLLPPALAAFYSPYAALYGHRLGAAAVGP